MSLQAKRWRRWPLARDLGRHLGAALAASIVALALSLVAGPAGAGVPRAPRLPAVQTLPTSLSALQAALNARVEHLDSLAGVVTSSKSLTPSDRATLTSMISNDLARLAALEASAASDATLSAIRNDGATMVSTLHVFSLVVPVVNGVLRADTAHASAVQIRALLPSIQASILASNASSGRVAHAKALSSALSSIASQIDATVLGVSSHLLAISPASVPAVLPTVGALIAQIASADQEVGVAYKVVSKIISLIAGGGAPQVRVRAS